MKIIAIIYTALYTFIHLYQVFTFGKHREPLSPGVWLGGLIINIPVYYIFYYIIINS